jgi:hypothetical protein
MAEAGNTTWDVVDVVAADAMRLCDEGLALEIDADTQLAAAPDGTPASKDFGDLLVSDCFIPQIVYSTTFGYRTDVAEWGGREPDDICDVFDLETFPGKRGLEKRPINNVEWALLCDGVAPDDVYDVLSTSEGVDRALAKLGTIRDNVVWWSAGAETPQRLADGEIVLGSTYNGRLFSLIEEQKQPVKMLWDWQVFDLDGWIIPAGPRLACRTSARRARLTISISPPTPSVWRTRPSTSRMVRHVPRRPRWSASMRPSASTWRRICQPTRRMQCIHSSTTTSSGLITGTTSTPNSRRGWPSKL